jgi:hypothetical protein
MALLDICRDEEDIGNIDKILQELQEMAGPYAGKPRRRWTLMIFI